MRIFVVTPPDAVVSLEEAKDHLRVRHDEEDELIRAYVAAATSHIDGPHGWLGRAIGVQTLEVRFPAFGTCGWIALPYPPAIDIVSVEYVDDNGASATLDPEAYETSGGMLRPTWPGSFPAAAWRGAAGETVRIQYRAGYEIVPPAIKAAILLMVGDLYANRETVAIGFSVASVPMSTTVDNLLSPFRAFC